MNAPITNIRKDRWGAWVATTKLPLAGERQLTLRTCKRDSGAVQTVASVAIVKRDGNALIETFEVYGDYMKFVRSLQPKRATEKAIREQQDMVIAEQLDDIMADVKAFYAAKGIEV